MRRVRTTAPQPQNVESVPGRGTLNDHQAQHHGAIDLVAVFDTAHAIVTVAEPNVKATTKIMNQIIEVKDAFAVLEFATTFFQVLLQAQARLERNDSRRSYRCSRPVIIHSVFDTRVPVLLRQDQDEVDVPAKGFREAATWGRVAL